MIEAEVRRAMADSAPEYLPPYEDPPDIDHPFVSEQIVSGPCPDNKR